MKLISICFFLKFIQFSIKGTNSSSSKYERSSWDKLKLLLWKNYKIQTRHKIQTIVELLLPLIFTIILVIIRILVKSTLVTEPTIYDSYALDNNPPYEVLFKWWDSCFWFPTSYTIIFFLLKICWCVNYQFHFLYIATKYSTRLLMK